MRRREKSLSLTIAPPTSRRIDSGGAVLGCAVEEVARVRALFSDIQTLIRGIPRIVMTLIWPPVPVPNSAG